MLGRMRSAMLVAVLSLSACGGPSGEDPPAPSPAASSEETAPPPDEARAPGPPEVAAPEAPPVDLLQSVATDLAVSSAYRGQAAQLPRLVDGSLETAWNSESGDLAGAWIEVRLPAGAAVTSIAMTAGFTHRTDRADLFTGNHRVARVRVLRDGAEVGVYALDVESRELQTLPVEGPGGVYRLEIAVTRPGTNASWREICVSELRVMGRAPDARDNERWPRFAVGQLPAPRSAEPPDRAAIAAAHRQQVISIERAWRDYEVRSHGLDNTTGVDESDDVELRELDRVRSGVLERVAAFVEPVDQAAADALRRRAATPHGIAVGLGYDHARLEKRGMDLQAIAAGMEAVTELVGDDEARCRWARAHAGLRVLRLEHAATNAWYLIEYNGEYGVDDSPAESRRQGRVDEMRDALSAIGRAWSSNAAGSVARLRRLDRSALPDDGAEFDALSAQLDRAQAACGWR